MQQITPSLFQISLGGVNAFIIKDDGLTLIDTGYKGSLNLLLTALVKGGENPDALKRVILTHAHPDHAGSAAAFKQKFGIPILAHRLEAPLLEQGLAGKSPIYRSPGLLNWVIYKLFIERGSSTIEPVAVDRSLNHNDVLPIAGGLQVLHTPGHTTGHIALWLKKEGVLIAGDMCAHIAGLDFSTVYEDRALAIESLLKTASLSFDKAVFGHGRPMRKEASQKLKAKFAASR